MIVYPLSVVHVDTDDAEIFIDTGHVRAELRLEQTTNLGVGDTGLGVVVERLFDPLTNTDVGKMEGSYQMVADSGEEFDAEIPAFTLAIPRTLH